MKLHTCRICGFSFYSRSNTNICKDCTLASNQIYDRIVAYLKQFPNSNALQISDALNIPAYNILTYLENGQLQESHGTFEQLKDPIPDTLPYDTRLASIAARKKE